jgi:FkbM family methyltransferase
MELSREKIYGSWRQKLAWLQHFLKARFNSKERPRVLQLAAFIPPGGVIFDVGAHFGYLAKEFCQIHGNQCSVYCFEPVSYTHSILVKVMRNHANAHVENFALSNQKGQIKITIPVKESGNLGIGLSHFGGESSSRDYITELIDTVRLDDYVLDQQIDRLDFIKCDVEGAELFVLQGASTSIDAYHPAIYCELSDKLTARLGYSTEAVFKFLNDKGYGAFILDSSGKPLPVTSVVDGADDYLFLHPSGHHNRSSEHAQPASSNT